MTSKIAKVIGFCDKLTTRVIIAFFALILCVSLYAVYDAICIHNQTRTIGEASKIIEGVPDDSRIAELKKTNEEIVAWVKIDDTAIDYPVTQTSNNQFYLSHDYKRDYSIAGSIFADYRSNLQKDDYSVIYGHNMNGDAMFGEINKFEDSSYFNKHALGSVYLEGARYEAEVLDYAIIASDNEYVYDLDHVANGANAEILAHIAEKSVNHNSSASSYNTLMLLSTCYLHSSQRAVLLMGYNK